MLSSYSYASFVVPLKMLTRFPANRIDIIFVRYPQPSMKDNEHILREFENRSIVILGPKTERRSDFLKELKNKMFKEVLVSFLIDYWGCREPEIANIIGNKVIYINNDLCYRFKCRDGKIERVVKLKFKCSSHEEADTKIIYHIHQTKKSNILIRCNDTDVLVILLSNIEFLNDSEKHIWIKMGVRNNVRIIDALKMYEVLGK